MGAILIVLVTGTIIDIGKRREAVAEHQCQAPGYETCEGLKANVRAANANEGALDIAVWQLILGGVGLIGVGYTVYYARNAWKEAERSANAAHAALEHTVADAGEQLERFILQLNAARDGARAMRSAASAMHAAAAAAETQAAIFGRQTDLIEKQHGIGRLQYFATQRPRLIVREVRITGTKPAATAGFTIANVGSSAAVIVESAATFAIREPGDLFVVSEPPLNEVGDVIIPPGGHHIHTAHSILTSFDLVFAAGEQDRNFWARSGDLYVFSGYIVYEDEVAKIRRRTAFWRVYDGNNRRFRAVDDPDREYAD